MATTSYLEAVSGGMVAAAAFSDDDAAVQAVTLLRESGVREQDITVLASDSQRAALVARGCRGRAGAVFVIAFASYCRAASSRETFASATRARSMRARSWSSPLRTG